MRRMDCDQVRPQIGEVIIAGKTLKIMRRTIGQELLHDEELKKAQKSLKRLIDSGKGYGTDEYTQLYNAWLRREIEIFIPEFTDKEFRAIDHKQREHILAMVFERDPEDFEKVDDTKKNKRKGDRPGEK